MLSILTIDNLEISRELLEQKDQLMDAWLHPKPDPNLYAEFDPTMFNIAVIGQSGNGKSSFVKTVLFTAIFSLMI